MEIDVRTIPTVRHEIVIKDFPKKRRFKGRKVVCIDPDVLIEAFDHLTSQPLNDGYISADIEEGKALDDLVELGVLRCGFSPKDPEAGCIYYYRSKKFKSFISKVPCLK